VTDLTAYRTEADPPDSPAAQRLYRMLLDGEIDAVTFTSPTAVRRFASLVGDEQAADLLSTRSSPASDRSRPAPPPIAALHPRWWRTRSRSEGLVSALVKHFRPNENDER
jgi:hypothetical protein